jgi:hypothetical protein
MGSRIGHLTYTDLKPLVAWLSNLLSQPGYCDTNEKEIETGAIGYK